LLGSRQGRSRPVLGHRADAVFGGKAERQGQIGLSSGLLIVHTLGCLAVASQHQLGPFFDDGQGTPLRDLGTDGIEHGLLAVDGGAGQRSNARRALGIQIESSGAIDHLVAFAGHGDGGAAGVLFCAGHVQALRPIEEELLRDSLHDAGRRALQAHREAAGVCHTAAGRKVRQEGVASDANRGPRLLLIQPYQRYIRILPEGEFDGLAQRERMNLSARQRRQCKKRNRELRHAFIVVSWRGAEPVDWRIKPISHPSTNI